MKTKIFDHLLKQKTHYALAVLILIVGLLFLQFAPLSQARQQFEREVVQDGGGFEFTGDFSIQDIAAENLPPDDSGAGDEVSVSTRYVTNGSSAAGYRTQTFQVTATLWYAWNRGIGSTLHPSSDSSISGWVAGLSDPNITIGYDFGIFDSTGTERIPEGSTIPHGTEVVMKFQPYISDNIFWFGTGYSMDSPYGEWRNGAAATPRVGGRVTCEEKDLTQNYQLDYGGTQYLFDVYIPFVVHPPQRTLTNVNGFSCGSLTTNGDGSQSATCTATGNGEVVPTFNYQSTYGKFYYRYYDYRDMTAQSWGGPGCYGNNIPMTTYFGTATGPDWNNDTTMRNPYQLSIPSQAFEYPLTIGEPGNYPPTPPTMSCPGTVTAGDDINVTLNSTDQDGDQVKYAVGWFSSAAPDSGWTNLVNSGTNGVRTKIGGYSTPGTYTIYGWAEDSNGNQSNPGATSCTVVVQDPPPEPPTTILEASINGGGWSHLDQTINPGDSVTLRWSSTNASSCTGTGSGFSTGSGTSGSDAVTAPAPNTSETFTISCSGAGGSGSDTITITTRQKPNFNQPSITGSASDSFNPDTGTYNFATITFSTTNDGGSGTQVGASYQVEFDRNSNGYEETQSGSLGTLSVGQTVTRNHTFTDVPFGSSLVRVTVDSTNAVDETNENDNVRTLDLDVYLPPPNPGLFIRADRIQVRPGDTVQLTWGATNPYPMDCRIQGPGVDQTTTNAIPSGTANPAISAKSEYTITCTHPAASAPFSASVVVETIGVLEEV